MLFTLPLPETTNHTYRSGRSGWYKTGKAKAWEEEAGWIFKRKWKRVPIKRFVYVGITWFLKYRRDIDGGIKPILDTLQRSDVYENDDQVIHMNVRKLWDKKNPRVEVEVEEMTNQ